MNLRRILDPGRASTPLLTSTPNGRTAAIASATLRRVQSAGEHELRACARAAPRRASRQSRRAAHRAFEQQRCVRQRARAGRLRRLHGSPASRCSPVGNRSVARSSTSVCSTSGRNTDHTSSSSALRRMQHHRDARNPARHALRELAPPAAPSPAASTARTRSRPRRRPPRPPPRPPRAWSGRRSSPRSPRAHSSSIAAPVAIRILRVRTAIARSRPAASISPSSLRGIVGVHQRRADERDVVADVDDRLDVLERADAALRHRARSPAADARPARRAAAGRRVSVSRSRQLTPTSICSSCALRAREHFAARLRDRPHRTLRAARTSSASLRSRAAR